VHMPHVDDLLDAYALGALDPEDVDLVERHIEVCDTCRSLLESSRQTAEELLLVAPQVAPPPELRERILARIRSLPANEQPGRQFSTETTSSEDQQASTLATSTAAPSRLSRLAQLFFGGSGVERDTEGRALRELLSEPDCRIWEVVGTQEAPDASARLVGTHSRQDAVLVARGLRSAGSGKAYQVWFLAGGKPLPASLFTVDRRGRGSALVRMTAPVDSFDTVAVTPEPEGGSPAPTGPIVLAGALER
jgi:anti-sigma-K factor RskA